MKLAPRISLREPHRTCCRFSTHWIKHQIHDSLDWRETNYRKPRKPLCLMGKTMVYVVSGEDFPTTNHHDRCDGCHGGGWPGDGCHATGGPHVQTAQPTKLGRNSERWANSRYFGYFISWNVMNFSHEFWDKVLLEQGWTTCVHELYDIVRPVALSTGWMYFCLVKLGPSKS